MPGVGNLRGGVGIYLTKTLNDVHVNNDLQLTKSCTCRDCDMESLFIEFSFRGISCVLGGIYRHPRGNKYHFTNDLESTLSKIDEKKMSIICGDININLTNYVNNEVMNYVSSMLSYRYLPYICLPTRITPHSATCIDHVFLRTPTTQVAPIEPLSGIIYCDISDHLPCFLSLKFTNNYCSGPRPKIRLFSERNCSNFAQKMRDTNVDAIYSDNTDWYDNFIKNVNELYKVSFPYVQLSRK